MHSRPLLFTFRRLWNPFVGIFHLLHPEGQVSARKRSCIIEHADTKDEQTVHRSSCFGICGNRNSRYDRLRFYRPDLAPVLAATMVGLHFLPLGKIFRQARYYFWGIAIMLWCGVCAILFRSNTLVAWSTIGTGILLWANCAHGLLRARGIVRSLVQEPDIYRASKI
jgi:hypothetical protein